jgi:transposase InsO family protein
VSDILDDHARLALGATAALRFSALAAWRAIESAITEHGAPRQLISDNGLQSISRDGHKPVQFQQRLAAMGIKRSAPGRAICKPMGSWSATTAPSRSSTPTRPPASIDELQALCDRFRWHYNHKRPHQSLNQLLPAEKYQALPKVKPGDPRPARRKTGPRVLRVFSAGTITFRHRKIGSAKPGKASRSPSSKPGPTRSPYSSTEPAPCCAN